MSIQKNIHDIQKKIDFFCQKYGRHPGDVKLIAVSKYHNTHAIEEAYHCGLRDFGENYFQEWQKKKESLSHLKDIHWHLIGHMQSNKAKFFTNTIHCLQSLDSLTLANAIEKKSNLEAKLNVLIQLQIDPLDKNKSGIAFPDAVPLCEFVTKSQKLNLCGFMGIGPAETPDDRRKDLYLKFMQDAGQLWKDFSEKDANTKPIYSLGMSGDLEMAIACGSNMVRIGKAVFGLRK